MNSENIGLSNDAVKSEPGPGDVTDLLLAWGQGDAAAFDRPVPVVHEQLRQIARRHMGRERVGHTLQPTALVRTRPCW